MSASVISFCVGYIAGVALWNLFVLSKELWPQTCVDCKKRLWPWQETGVDYQSHAACHLQRMVEFGKWQDEQNAKCDAAIYKAIMEISARHTCNA